MVDLEVTLSEWIYNSVLGREVLTISRDYFRLRKPLERRVYEIARKHCGQQKQWAVSLETLQKKCGSSGSLRQFRAMVKTLAHHDHLPDYHVALTHDTVKFTNRETMMLPTTGEGTDFPLLHPSTYEKARKAAPRQDVYFLEQEWHQFWMETGKPEFKSPDAAFIAFCARRSK